MARLQSTYIVEPYIRRRRIWRQITALIGFTALGAGLGLWAAYADSERQFHRQAGAFHNEISRHVNESETVLTGFAALLNVFGLEFDAALRSYARSMLASHPHLHELAVQQRVRHQDLSALRRDMARRGRPDFELRAFNFFAGRGWFPPPVHDHHYPIVFIEPEPKGVRLLGMDPSLDPILAETMERAKREGRPVASPPFERMRGGYAYVVFSALEGYGDEPSKIEGFTSLLVRAEELTPEQSIPAYTNVRIRPHETPGSRDLFRVQGVNVNSFAARLLPPFRFEAPTVGPGPRMTVQLEASATRAVFTHPLGIAAFPGALLLAGLGVLAYRLREGRQLERWRAAATLFREREREEVTLQAIGDAVITTDIEGRIEFMNPAAERLSGQPLEGAQWRPFSEVMPLVEVGTDEPMPPPIHKCVTHNIRCKVGEAPQVVSGRNRIDVEALVSPLHDYSGAVSGTVLVMRDVTQQRRIMREVSWEAIHDPLTGLINRRGFERELTALLESHVAREGQDLLCYLDLDGFKPVNDQHGHAIGDGVLTAFAQRLRNTFRRQDRIARLGGDEFGLLLTGCGLEVGRRKLQELATTLEDEPVEVDGKAFPLRFSAGVAVLNAADTDLTEVMRRADGACYAAKRHRDTSVWTVEQ